MGFQRALSSWGAEMKVSYLAVWENLGMLTGAFLVKGVQSRGVGTLFLQPVSSSIS